jgi:pyruvate/2-oxoglutarate dehydrogenase complex dihydrolipoamide dehydrogenase (E3) component
MCSSSFGKHWYSIKRKTGTESGARVPLAIGRLPDIEGLGIEKAGLGLDKGFIKVNRRMQTNITGLYAVG